MPYPKGAPKPKGSGRKKGTPNKLTRDVKEAILEAFQKGGKLRWKNPKTGLYETITCPGGVEYLQSMMISHPEQFLTLLGKLLPLQLTGEGGGPVEFQEVKIIAVPANKDTKAKDAKKQRAA